MITDQEVTDLYRCILARAPETDDTIAAFKVFHRTMEGGRRAIFGSDEFRGVFERVTGRVLDANENVSGALALALLKRGRGAGTTAAAPPSPIASGLRQFFAGRQAPGLAVVVGRAEAPSLAELAPFTRGGSAILHIASGFPGDVPEVATLADGSVVFRLDTDAEGLNTLLADCGRRIDAIVLLDHSAGATWVNLLRDRSAPRLLVVLGRAAPGFDPLAVSQAIARVHDCETTLDWEGLRLMQLGGWLLPVAYMPAAAPPRPPQRAAYPALAVAAIVRNEAVCITNMLASVLPVASFYAVLDTGSEDETEALAQRFLAECGVPHTLAVRPRSAFDDDFAAMRNAALDMVPASIPWVLMLDADEEMVPEDLTPLLELLAAADADGTPDAFSLPRYNFPGTDKSGAMTIYPDRQVRLLRNGASGRIRYQGAVHETVTGAPAARVALDASALGLARGGPHIHHLVRRFRTQAEEERKQEFYREIARRHAAHRQVADT